MELNTTPIRIMFLQLNDLHAQMFPHSEVFWRRGKPVLEDNYGGIAKIAAFLQDKKARNPDSTLVVDCGDAFFGSYFTHIENGAALVPLLNSLGVDVGNGGHWEYYYGPERFLELATMLNYPLYAVNIYKHGTRARVFSAFGVFQLSGVRVAMLGLASTIVDESMPKPFAGDLEFTDGMAADELPALILQAREQADLVCLSSHMGLPQDIAIASQISGIDVIFSAHTHDRLLEPIFVPHQMGNWRTIVMQSGFSGSFVGELQLDLSRSEGGVCIQAVHHKLHGIAAHILPDKVVQQKLEAIYLPFRQSLEQPLGETDCDLHRMLTFETPMDNLLLLCMKDTYAADVYVSRAWRFCPPKPKGLLYERDLWDMVPMAVKLFQGRILGADLRKAAEKWLTTVMTDPLKQTGGYVTRQLGLHAIVRVNNPDGYRIEELHVGDELLDLERTYEVVIAGEQVMGDMQSEWRELPIDLHEAIRRRLLVGSVDPGLTHDKFILG
ncbi:MAG: bifunctional metallophosphatase/5'-nucleotidase [Bacilli bacterium]